MLQDDDLDKARYEIKFVDHSSNYDQVRNWLTLNASCFRIPYPARVVNNIYFDNVELDSYIENLSGASSRTKIRLRWYGDSLNSTNAVLELKSKRNRLGFKVGQKIRFQKPLAEISYNELITTIEDQLEGDFSLRFKLQQSPIIVNRYHREYFVTNDNIIRATLDKDIHFYDQRFSHKINFNMCSLTPEMMVLEIKSPAREIDLAAEVVKNIRITPSKSSKYVIGVQSLLGYQ